MFVEQLFLFVCKWANLISKSLFSVWNLEAGRQESRQQKRDVESGKWKSQIFLSAIENARKDFAFSAHQLVDVQYISNFYCFNHYELVPVQVAMFSIAV